MSDPSELARKAQELKTQAEREPDAAIRDRLIHMAEDYARLAESLSEKQAHPIDAAALGGLFQKGG